MIILDTDIVSLLDHDKGNVRAALIARLQRPENADVCTTVITLEEQMRGWLSYLASAKSLQRQVEGYRQLQQLFRAYARRPVLDFDDAASRIFERLKRSRIRVGTMDLKIAAIVIANDATLISRNLGDFSQVPELTVEDWTKPG